MNGDQWANSGVCGMCVEVWGSGKLCKHGQQRNDCGMGRARYAPRKKFIAVVTDELGERQFGDIDIGEYGDGHYPVSWKPVVCPWNCTSSLSNPHFALYFFCPHFEAVTLTRD